MTETFLLINGTAKEEGIYSEYVSPYEPQFDTNRQWEDHSRKEIRDFRCMYCTAVASGFLILQRPSITHTDFSSDTSPLEPTWANCGLSFGFKMKHSRLTLQLPAYTFVWSDSQHWCLSRIFFHFFRLRNDSSDLFSSFRLEPHRVASSAHFVLHNLSLAEASLGGCQTNSRARECQLVTSVIEALQAPLSSRVLHVCKTLQNELKNRAADCGERVPQQHPHQLLDSRIHEETRSRF